MEMQSEDTDGLVMDLALRGSARGARAKPMSMDLLGPLGPEHLPELATPTPLAAATPSIAKLRHAHHMLARALAGGMNQNEAAFATGYSPSRVSILQHDPAFAELVEYYRGQKDEIFLDVTKRLATIGLSAADELQERLEESPKTFSNGQLMELSTAFLDRSVTQPKGQGPSGAPGPAVQFVVNFVKPKGQDESTIIEHAPLGPKAA